MIKSSIMAVAAACLAMASTVPGHAASPVDAPGTTRYRTIKVDGLSIFYREAGRPDAPAILLLHGVPSSSRMYEPLFSRLSAQFHLIAPDYPGFGHSDAPNAKEFGYTFDHIAAVIRDFTEALG